jgi:excisionase family DNA binding protein
MQRSPTKRGRQRAAIEVKPEYVSRKGAAAMLSVSDQLIAKFNKQGTLPMYRVGRVVRIKVADLEAMLRRGQ